MDLGLPMQRRAGWSCAHRTMIGLATLLSGCSGLLGIEPPSRVADDASTASEDASEIDAAEIDAAIIDAAIIDAAKFDAGKFDATVDAKVDATVDATVDARPDSSMPDGRPDADTSAPEVVSTTPSDGASDGAPDLAVRATFSRGMKASTFTAANVSVTADDSPVTGSIAYDSGTRTVTFTPSRRLGLHTSIRVTLSRGITDTANVPLAAAHVWTFTVRDGSWSSPTGIAGVGEGVSMGGLDVASAADGTTMLAWSTTDVWARRRTAAGNWDGPARVELTDGDVGDPLVVIDDSGRATATFVLTPSGGTANLYANRFVNGGWGQEVTIERSSFGVVSHSLAGRRDGGAVAAWSQNIDDSHQAVYANRFTNDWQGPTPLSGTDLTFASYPMVAVRQGESVTVWTQQRGTRTSVWSTRYTNGVDPSLELETGPTEYTMATSVAIAPDGTAVALWGLTNGTRALRASRRSGGNWSGPTTLGVGDEPRMEIGASGDGLAVWPDNNGSQSAIRSRRYRRDGSWGSIETVTASGAHHSDVRLVRDGHGNAIAAWGLAYGGTGVWVNRFTPESGWGDPRRIDSSGDSDVPRLAIDGQGRVILVWRQSTEIWMARFE